MMCTQSQRTLLQNMVIFSPLISVPYVLCLSVLPWTYFEKIFLVLTLPVSYVGMHFPQRFKSICVCALSFNSRTTV
jgi:hypothetical protein